MNSRQQPFIQAGIITEQAAKLISIVTEHA